MFYNLFYKLSIFYFYYLYLLHKGIGLSLSLLKELEINGFLYKKPSSSSGRGSGQQI